MKNTTRHNTLRRAENKLLFDWKTALAAALCAAAFSQPGNLQAAITKAELRPGAHCPMCGNIGS